MVTPSLYWIHTKTSSQCSSEWRNCIRPRSNFPVPLTTRAATFSSTTTGDWRPGQYGVTVFTSQHEMWRRHIQDSQTQCQVIEAYTSSPKTYLYYKVISQMERADSPKWIWNRFRFRLLDHALLRYFWWYAEVFLRRPSFPSQTMRVRSCANVITYCDIFQLFSVLTSYQ